MQTMDNLAVVPFRRLNGRLQACDPCRSRKEPCDHTRPVCVRCRKRKQDRHCIYTLSSSSVQSQSQSLSPTTAVRRPASVAASTEISSRDIGIDRVGIRKSTRPYVRNQNSRAPGYLGYTSYCTVIGETLSILSDQPEEQLEGELAEDIPVFIPPKFLQLSIAVLAHVPLARESKAIFQSGASIYDTFVYRIATRILLSLYEEFGKYLGSDRDVIKLEELGRKICSNTSKPVLDASSPDEWLTQFAGPNLRWESLGILFGYWFLPNNPTEDGAGELLYSVQSEECSAHCIELSQEFSDGNFLLVYLNYRRSVNESIISGDASRQTWKCHADTVSNLNFLGLHAEPKDAQYVPSFLVESKRRVVAAVFSVDKCSVSFTGRPPLLSRRYVTTPLPLDLKDDYLFSDQATLVARSKDTLDKDGWNTEGGFYATTYLRARVIISKIKERIAEIALGSEPLPPVAAIKSIKNDQSAAISKFPVVLIYNADDVANPKENMTNVFGRLKIKLDCLQNEFFLERLCLQQGQLDDGELLAISFEMVSLTITLWTHRDRFTKMRDDFEWLLVGYGAPAGGILCKELLRPTLHGNQSKSAEITRSAITQKLSLLVAFLDWVRPTAPNANLCNDCKLVIQRVLDQALNIKPSGGAVPEIFDWDFSGQPDFNFDLLHTFDWIHSSF